MYRRSLMGLGMAALAMAFAGGAAASVVTPNRRRRLPKSGTRYAANGKQECARRRAQISAGRLKAANGLCVQ